MRAHVAVPGAQCQMNCLNLERIDSRRPCLVATISSCMAIPLTLGFASFEQQQDEGCLLLTLATWDSRIDPTSLAMRSGFSWGQICRLRYIEYQYRSQWMARFQSGRLSSSEAKATSMASWTAKPWWKRAKNRILTAQRTTN